MSAARDADRPLDETRVTADLPGLRIELLRRELPEAGAERITIDLLATASFAALKLPYGLAPMMAANPALTVVVPQANQESAADRLKVDPERLTPIAVGQPVSRPPFTFHAVPAAHEDLVQDEDGYHSYLGYVVEAGPWTIYHSGDTVLYDGLAERLRAWQIDLAILPIDGRGRGVAGNLSGEEAAALAHLVGAGVAIPCHYDMFAFNTASPNGFIQAAQRLGQPYAVLQNGQRWSGYR